MNFRVQKPGRQYVNNDARTVATATRTIFFTEGLGSTATCITPT